MLLKKSKLKPIFFYNWNLLLTSAKINIVSVCAFKSHLAFFLDRSPLLIFVLIHE